MFRREFLGGLAALPGLGLDIDLQSSGSHHPGPPRFIHAGQSLTDPLADEPNDRTALAPRIPNPTRDPEKYDASAFAWRVSDRPEASSATVSFRQSASGTEYDPGTDNVAEFTPDVPGTYTLELSAPDGVHEVTVRVFPEPTTGAGPPRCSLSGHFDAESDAFVVTAETAAAPDSDRADAEVGAEFHPDDRSTLSRADVSVEGTTARVPKSALDGRTRLHGVAVGDRHSVADVVVLDPEAERVETPNRAPDWIKNATVYEIFTRSFGPGPGDADFAYLESKVPYLEDLGVDAVWLTPILQSYTHRNPNSPGGPHGYDIEDYFETADALGTMAEFESFVDACHDADIRVIFDFVANHTSETHPFLAQARDEGEKYYDWYNRSAGGGFDNYYGWSLRNLNYENVAVREHMLAVADYWADVVDGFRCDIAWGVQHSFWKEVRQRVKARDPEFLLLDETWPYDADFDAAEFDMHFDTNFNAKLRSIAVGKAPSVALEGIEDRKRNGFPDHTVMLQYVENHDMARYLDLADLHTQRAAIAATFTLPGVPMIYYGQERALSNYSGRRLNEKGHFRAFMNWDEYDESQLRLHERLVEARSTLPALDHDADLVRLAVDRENVLAFGRDAGGIDRSGDPQRVVVLLHFGEGSATVPLPSAAAGTTDLLTDTDLATENGGVAVETVAVLEAGPLTEVGAEIASFEDPAGDDDGPGEYTYPEDPQYTEGSLDLRRVSAHETDDSAQFRVTVGDLSNPTDRPEGFAAQHLQCYLRDPEASGGSVQGRTGTNLGFDAPYQYRVVVDGADGARVEDHEGTQVATGTVSADTANDTLLVDVPKSALDTTFAEYSVAVLLAGYDPEAPGGVEVVPETGPNVFDCLTTESVTQAEALSSEDDAEATVPYLPLTVPYRPVRPTIEDATGDNHGPGGYELPTNDAFYEGVMDLQSLSVLADRERLRFDFEMAALDNDAAFGFEEGFSHEFLQIYVRDTAAEGATTSTRGRTGTNVTFSDPYHYRIVATGEDKLPHAVEAPDRSVVTEDVAVGVEGTTITVDVPIDAVASEGLDSLEFAALVCPYDGYRQSGRDGSYLRGFQSTAGEWPLGAETPDQAPRVVDMAVGPEAPPQAEQLSYSESAFATVEYVPLTAATAEPPARPEVVPGSPAGNLDGDDLLEDVDGDGDGDVFDAITYYNERDSAAVRSNVAAFDFADDGDIDLFDAIELYNELG